MSCGCPCVSCKSVTLCSAMVRIMVSCLCLPCFGLLMYCLPRPACVFQVVIDIGGGGGFGPPSKRSAQAIEEDLVQGYTN